MSQENFDRLDLTKEGNDTYGLLTFYARKVALINLDEPNQLTGLLAVHEIFKGRIRQIMDWRDRGLLTQDEAQRLEFQQRAQAFQVRSCLQRAKIIPCMDLGRGGFESPSGQ